MTQEPDRSVEMSEDALENLCRRCGRCCHVKFVIGDEVFITAEPCPYLDVETNLCTVYERRHEANPNCLTVEEGIARRVFPADCPYVADLPGYRPPREEWSVADIEQASLARPEASDVE